MQIRFLFYEFRRRVAKHRNYVRVMANMEAKYVVILFLVYLYIIQICLLTVNVFFLLDFPWHLVKN